MKLNSAEEIKRSVLVQQIMREASADTGESLLMVRSVGQKDSTVNSD